MVPSSWLLTCKEVNELMKPGIIPKLWGKSSAKVRGKWMWKEYQIHIGEMNEMDVMTCDWAVHEISSSTVYEFELLLEVSPF